MLLAPPFLKYLVAISTLELHSLPGSRLHFPLSFSSQPTILSGPYTGTGLV